MSRICWILLVVSFLFSAELLALPKKNIHHAKIKFDYTTNLKFQKIYTLSVKNKKIYVNGFAMKAEDVFVHNKTLKYVFNSKERPATQLRCAAGKYRFDRKVNKKHSKESGCINTKRFAQLSDAFERLSKIHTIGIKK